MQVLYPASPYSLGSFLERFLGGITANDAGFEPYAFRKSAVGLPVADIRGTLPKGVRWVSGVTHWP